MSKIGYFALYCGYCKTKHNLMLFNLPFKESSHQTQLSNMNEMCSKTHQDFQEEHNNLCLKISSLRFFLGCQSALIMSYQSQAHSYISRSRLEEFLPGNSESITSSYYRARWAIDLIQVVTTSILKILKPFSLFTFS